MKYQLYTKLDHFVITLNEQVFWSTGQLTFSAIKDFLVEIVLEIADLRPFKTLASVIMIGIGLVYV